MSVNLQRMRLCFKVAAVWCDWSEAEQAEISAAIRADIEANDVDDLAWWAWYLEEASGLEYLAARCRAFEASIKAKPWRATA